MNLKMKNLTLILSAITLSLLSQHATALTKEVPQPRSGRGPLYLTNDRNVTKTVEKDVIGYRKSFVWLGAISDCPTNNPVGDNCTSKVTEGHDVSWAFATAFSATVKFTEVVSATLQQTITRTFTKNYKQESGDFLARGYMGRPGKYVRRVDTTGSFVGAWVRTGEKSSCDGSGFCSYSDVYTARPDLVVSDYTLSRLSTSLDSPVLTFITWKIGDSMPDQYKVESK